MNGDDIAENLPEFEDSLEPIGVLAGGFLVLVGLATLVGMPWQYTNGIAVMLVQIIGILGTIVVGAAIVWLAQTRQDGLPGQ